jgi:predicted XRE-type DNA-binding protein
MKAEAALGDLVAELDRCIEDLARARERAGELLVQRRSGQTWTEIVSQEKVSINRIAAMFGVTRQRISALLNQ